MLLNKLNFAGVIVCLFFVLNSCGEKKSSPGKIISTTDFNNPAVVNSEAEKILGANMKFAYKGNFDSTKTVEIAAGTEIKNKTEWGIKFYLLKLEKNKLVKIYQTNLLKGSFKESLTKKIIFPAFNYELIYYNSQDYFMGSGGGEIFSYIIDFNNRKSFYAHLFSKGDKILLYLSNNIDNNEIKNFFIGNFKKDYANLNIVQKDVNIDN